MTTEAELRALLAEARAEARAEAIEECWQAVNALIQEGELPQELHDRRNGFVLASNAISALAHPKGEDHGNR